MKKKQQTQQENQHPELKPLVEHPVSKETLEENAEPITEENLDKLADEEDIYEDDKPVPPPEPGEGP